MSGMALLFVLADVVLTIWAVWMGFAGLTATHPAFREGGHAPGAEGTYDPIYMEKLAAEKLKAA